MSVVDWPSLSQDLAALAGVMGSLHSESKRIRT